MDQMSAKDASGQRTIEQMAKLANVPVADFTNQLKTTALFYTPKSALEYLRSKELRQKQELVRAFCFAHGLLGENVRSGDAVGILYQDGTVDGDKRNIKMRYVDTFEAEAANGKLSLKLVFGLVGDRFSQQTVHPEGQGRSKAALATLVESRVESRAESRVQESSIALLLSFDKTAWCGLKDSRVANVRFSGRMSPDSYLSSRSKHAQKAGALRSTLSRAMVYLLTEP
jgi:hypothetical protein